MRDMNRGSEKMLNVISVYFDTPRYAPCGFHTYLSFAIISMVDPFGAVCLWRRMA
jgi:hypothetical protein